ncbi:alkaline phosphatase [Niabella yanshanensis]|uniref:Alkaline phosphatase n=1 Tax=Niabella yanshanensis TaxID=577386 RepID=A0ABZ0W7Z5_9BACT|nr:alkaline phosphatase [Niabella yanshanensis]WQD38794.1 alkaline phosphatase [Niabella yanshanensis]
MKRKDFFKTSSLAFLGTALTPSISANSRTGKRSFQTAKNIIFLVSDGMSNGTLSMADLLMQRQYGKRSTWLTLYDEHLVSRALMDTASANSFVTDSAAASSSWGGGIRVNNGALNVNADGSENKPILQKFKDAGKSVGCVTTVPITHATPAGFCVTSKKRDDQSEIALKYLSLRFDVMMGGGLEYFSKEKRSDRQDVFKLFKDSGFAVVRDKKAMLELDHNKPVLGVFHEAGLPFALDAAHQPEKSNLPTLAEMTGKAISILSRNQKGFVLQVEGGKVDWAAHANDCGALLYDQLAFDEAVKVAFDFAQKDKETLVVITTDHGNANPGLFYGSKANSNFDTIIKHRFTNEWILNGVNSQTSATLLRDRVMEAQGWILTDEEARELLAYYVHLSDEGLYNPRHLPFKRFAQLQEKHTSVGWGSMDHSGDYVELAMYGPGRELLQPFIKNYELHQLMLDATAIKHYS